MEVASKFACHLPGCPGICSPSAARFVPGPAYTKTDMEFDFLKPANSELQKCLLKKGKTLIQRYGMQNLTT